MAALSECSRGTLWGVLLFSLAWCGFIFGFALPKNWRNLQAKNYPAVQGQLAVEGIRQNAGKANKETIKVKGIEVDFEWQGKNYIATDVGLNYTHQAYRKAKASGTCTVYVDESSPEKSLLSAGLPLGAKIGGGIFLLISLPIGVLGIYAFILLCKKSQSQKLA